MGGGGGGKGGKNIEKKFLGNLESFFSNLEHKLTQPRWSKFFLRLGQLCLANLVGPIS